MGYIDSNDHSLTFRDNSKLRVVYLLVNATELQVEFESHVGHVFILPSLTGNFRSNDANGVKSNNGVSNVFDACKCSGSALFLRVK